MNISTDKKDAPLILAIDDDKFMRLQLRRAMEEVGYQVVEAANGEEGLVAYTRWRPDIVLLDAVMPVMDGFTFCKLIRTENICQTQSLCNPPPVLMITALEDRESVDRAFEAGANDYITKPIHWAVLRQRVRRLLEACRAEIDRQRSEQKIREQAALLDIATEAILVQNLDNQILFWNKGAERLYGWRSEEAIGKNVNQLLYKQVPPELESGQPIFDEAGSWQGELLQVTKYGKEIIVESRWTLVQEEQKQPKSILTVNTDITEKKQLETQFLRAQRMESIGTLASGIAHDLNNALAPILMSVQLLEMKCHDEHSQRLLKILEANTKRSADLVKQVLSFARGLQGDRTNLQVAHLISEIAKIVKQTFPKCIEIYTDVPSSEIWTVCGDATQLHQVLMNLCVNARDAMPKGGILNVVAENIFIDENYARMNIEAKVGKYVVITVSDTGTGIPREILDRIFEPFFTTKEHGKGTGLGLSTAVGIVKGHGGFINVYSEVGKGTKFKVCLPAASTDESKFSQEIYRELPRGNGELVLVVDDEDAIREITKTSLESYNYQAIGASNGIEAIALYAERKTNISVVLVDMMMPMMDGPTTIRTLQKINPNVKIIAISGLTSNSQVTELNRQSVQTFLPKPFTSEELLKSLRSVIATDGKN
ncbi:response regulator [Planktothrix sp. FACHB-1355]|uniref:histidine kinase n=1 Tax=Aerosakkonema funiforme FACHB-1375 TaxID=2949571 RepID=A0A926VGD5_9CYAN|nr:MULTISPECIES: response regulator [Oscillatoriales]MBD2183229.1 response regulator [Aerosakkonema funiforme FACHB-1375]MBD3559451.1 response regulator [Planktothrix sp. FACHB-1355]